MPFEVFCEKCRKICNKAGNLTDVRFSNEGGKYTAYFSDGVTIQGNSVSLKVGVYWGSGHKALASI